MCWNQDIVSYSAFEEVTDAEYFDNDKLMEQVRKKYEGVSGWYLMKGSFTHLPLMAIEYFYESKLTYCFGFSRSSIFSCAAALDTELKSSLKNVYPEKITHIEKQTFGKSIRYLQANPTQTSMDRNIDMLLLINNIRNKIAVHPYNEKYLQSFIDIFGEVDEIFALNSNEILKFLEEFDIPEDEITQRTDARSLLDLVNLKIIEYTRLILSGL